MIKRIFLVFMSLLFVLTILPIGVLHADDKVQDADTIETRDDTVRPTILPDAYVFTVEECQQIMNAVSLDTKQSKDIMAKREKESTELNVPWSIDYDEILGCGIKTGDIPLWMVVYYVRWILEFIIAIAGIVTVGGMIYGGYLYLFAGLSDDKDKGKNAIKNSAIGLILTLTAWGIVSVVIALVSS